MGKIEEGNTPFTNRRFKLNTLMHKVHKMETVLMITLKKIKNFAHLRIRFPVRQIKFCSEMPSLERHWRDFIQRPTTLNYFLMVSMSFNMPHITH